MRRDEARNASLVFFFFNDAATTEIYTLSLHDALPIFADDLAAALAEQAAGVRFSRDEAPDSDDLYIPPINKDRKSTRLNSSHANISYAVFCLLKKKLIPPHHCARAGVQPGVVMIEAAR